MSLSGTGFYPTPQTTRCKIVFSPIYVWRISLGVIRMLSYLLVDCSKPFGGNFCFRIFEQNLKLFSELFDTLQVSLWTFNISGNGLSLLCVPRAIRIQTNRAQPTWCQRKEQSAFQRASFPPVGGRRWEATDGTEGNVFIYKRGKWSANGEGKQLRPGQKGKK